MCRAVPGRILAISSAGEDDDPLWRQAEVAYRLPSAGRSD
jgi:hypothetical protein